MTAQALPSITGCRVLERLGRGATSDVLLAEGEVERRGVREKVIVKVLSLKLGEGDSALIPFKREVEAYGKISTHSALVELKRAIVTEDDLVVLVLEYVEGISLAKLLSGLGPGERLPDGVVLHVMERIFAGLAAAHAHEPTPVVHGEMRTSNVLLGWDGSVKLADFGVTKSLEDDPREAATPASDVYAASLVIWELFTGSPAAQGTAEKQDQMLDELRPDLPRAVRQLVATGLAPDPKDRKLSAADIVQVLTKNLPLERGKDKLAELLAAHRPAHVVVPERSGQSPAEKPQDAEPVLDKSHATALRMLGGEPGAPARREPRTHRAPLSRSSDPDSNERVTPVVNTPLPAETKPVAVAAVAAPAKAPPPSLRPAPPAPIAPPRAPAATASPWPKRASIAVIALCLVVVIATKMARDKEAETATVAGSAIGPSTPPPPSPPAPTASELQSSASLAANPSATDMGDLRAGATALEHRVFVDGKVVGEGPGVYRVKCGKRLVRVGSGDEEKELDVPCGGEVAISPSPRRTSEENQDD